MMDIFNDNEKHYEEVDRLLKLHLKYFGVPCSEAWSLRQSPIGGRGLFATKNLSPGDIVFMDAPMVVGPRTGENSAPLCVGCHKSGAPLVPCSRGCRLPVCNVACEQSEGHKAECERLVGWLGEKCDASSWSPDFLRALTPIRCLSLNDDLKRLVRCLEAHTGPLHEHEVDSLKEHLGQALSADDEEFMRFCCCAMDANAFETATQSVPVFSDADALPLHTSLRGLYPLSAMMNHACTPNTRHGYDKDFRMTVKASVPIPQGTEITTSYFAILWGTSARRHHLSKTKHFFCFCSRCRDPREGGTCLCALKCAISGCPGSLLSEDPLKVTSKWACDRCGVRVPQKEVRLIQSGLGTMLRVVKCDDPVHVAAFLRGHQRLFVTSNQVIVELKSCLVWIYGHQQGYKWQELSDANLETKESICRELLRLLELLQAGQCRLRGLILFELHCTLAEKLRRRQNSSEGNEMKPLSLNDLGLKDDEMRSTIEEAASMFENDVTAPPDIWVRLGLSRNVCQ